MFIESAIKLFSWSPSKSVWSLVQKCGALLCSLEASQQKLAELEAKVTQRFRTFVDVIVKEKFASSFSHLDTSTDISNNNLTEFLSSHKYQSPTGVELEYLRVSIRVAEKLRFVNHMGDESQRACIIHLCRAIPRLLKEFGSVMEVSTLINAFFRALKEALVAVDRHDEVQKDGNMNYVSDETNRLIVSDVNAALGKILKTFYPAMRKMHALRGTPQEPKLWIAIIDFCAENILQVNNPKMLNYERNSADLGPGLQMGGILAESGVDLSALSAELEIIQACSQSGMHESLWPHLPVITDELLPRFHAAISKVQ
jgi:hypothetical protein